MKSKKSILNFGIPLLILLVISITLIILGGLIDYFGLVWYYWGFFFFAVPGAVFSVPVFVLLISLVRFSFQFKAETGLSINEKKITSLAISSLAIFSIGFILALVGHILYGIKNYIYINYFLFSLAIPGFVLLISSILVSLVFVIKFYSGE